MYVLFDSVRVWFENKGSSKTRIIALRTVSRRLQRDGRVRCKLAPVFTLGSRSPTAVTTCEMNSETWRHKLGECSTVVRPAGALSSRVSSARSQAAPSPNSQPVAGQEDRKASSVGFNQTRKSLIRPVECGRCRGQWLMRSARHREPRRSSDQRNSALRQQYHLLMPRLTSS